MRFVLAILLVVSLFAACKKEGRRYEPTTTPTSPTAVIDAGTDASADPDAGPPAPAPTP
jgi:hypothetical protein